MTDEKMPVVKCFPREENMSMFQFWCPFCREWHRHGRGAGHRGAHCFDPSSPFHETGYIVEHYTRDELLMLQALIDTALEAQTT